jgi:hypothetical protein
MQRCLQTKPSTVGTKATAGTLSIAGTTATTAINRQKIVMKSDKTALKKQSDKGKFARVKRIQASSGT